MDDPRTDEAPPTRSSGYKAPVIVLGGKYRLLERIGEGGMGIVFLAEQSAPIRRKVAVKIIKQGMETKAVLARFAAEEQALALMSHPNIAKVFDAGVTDVGREFLGQAYFVMEHVPGVPITRYCEEQKLPTRARLQLFAQVCDAIQHAHQKGIIHRDIKPSNVLVTLEGPTPVPKVIDFGVAKATAQPLTDQTLYTEQGRFIGTPEYMSPEQAGVTALDIDTRSDVYTLGVLLYELLTGFLPFDTTDLRTAGLAEMQRIIREADPPRPSARLSTIGAPADGIAARQHTDVRALTQVLRRDLDWVVMRALEKDRTRRYPSASEFAEDVRRHLADEPVLAGPPTVSYRVTKFVRRHKALVAAAGAIVLTLAAGLGATSLMYLRAMRETARAEQQRVKAAGKGYVACIQAADAGLRVREIRQVKERLAACELELRHWEWGYLSHQADSSVAVFLAPENAPLLAFFSSDGSRVLGWSASLHPDEPSGHVVAWDGGTSKLLSREVLPGKGRFWAAVSSDGARLLRIDRESPTRQSISVVEGGTGGEITALQWTPTTDSEIVSSAVFDQAGRQVATGGAVPRCVEPLCKYGFGLPVDPRFGRDGRANSSDDGNSTVRVFDADSGRLIDEFIGHRRAVWGLAFSRDSRKLASASEDATVRIWDLLTHRLRTQLKGHENGVVAVAFSSDGSRVVTGSMDSTVRIWAADDGRLLQTFRGHDGAVLAVAFSPDGRHVVSGSIDKTVRLWDTTNGRPSTIWLGHEAAVKAVSFRSDGTQVLSSSDDGTARLWNVAGATGLESLLEHGWDDLDYSQNGAVIAAHSLNEARTWNAGTKQVMAEISLGVEKEPNEEIREFALSEDGETIAAGLVDSTVRVWEARSGRLVLKLPVSKARARISFRPRSTQIAVAHRREIEVFDIRTSEKVLRLEIDGSDEWVEDLMYSPDGSILAVVEVVGLYGDDTKQPATIRLFDASSGRQLSVVGKQDRGSFFARLRFSPDGKRLARAHGKGVVSVLDVAESRVLNALQGHASEIRTVSFSPDGRRIVTAANDRTVRVWDASTGDQLLVLRWDRNDPSGAVFTPDGNTVLSWKWLDGEPAKIWSSK